MTGSVLALYLDAPLQSWGHQSRFDRRTTLSYPTRSGVLGMLCAAMGLGKTDLAGLVRLDSLELAVYGFTAGSRLTDYHTVGGGYDKKRQRQHIGRKASGAAGDTVLTYRDYLQGGRFGTLLGGTVELLQELDAALRDPRWGIWLGRKCCVPASPVAQGVFATEGEALDHLRGLEARRIGCEIDEVRVLRRVVEVAGFADGTDTLMDRPLDFGKRRFAPRRVSEGPG